MGSHERLTSTRTNAGRLLLVTRDRADHFVPQKFHTFFAHVMHGITMFTYPDRDTLYHTQTCRTGVIKSGEFLTKVGMCS